MKRAAFTLVEMVVSLAVIGVLLTAMGSALVLVSHAMPRGDTRQERQAAAAAVLDELCAEVTDALYLAERTEHAMTFSTPDRDGDGYPERIRYAWSGLAGDPLTRSYNGSAPATVVDDVQSLAFGYQTTSVTETYPGAIGEGGETLLSGHTAAIGSLNQQEVDYNKQVAQEITPTFPAGAIAWRVTRVQVEARQDNLATETTQVRLSPLRFDGMPDATSLAEVALPELNLATTPAWEQVDVPDAPLFLPTDRVMLVLASDSLTGVSMRIRYDSDAQGPTSYLRSGDRGSSWSVELGRSLRHAVYGRFTIQADPQRLTRRYVTGVTIAATIGDGDAAHVRAATALLNRPEALDAYWHADFDIDPTRLDSNADGQGDWHGQTTVSLLSGGLLAISDTLDARPANDFTAPVTLDATFRATSSLGGEAGVSIQADRRGDGACVTLLLVAEQPLLGSQTLRLQQARADGSRETLLTVDGLDGDLLDTRLLIDPTRQTVCLAVDGRYAGTLYYERHLPAENRPYVTLLGGGGAEFDSVTVRVGGDPE